MMTRVSLPHLLVMVILGSPAMANAESRLQFNRDIRPILSDHCYQCHGPDKEKRKGKLRLDREEDVRAAGIITPGKPETSELIRRVTTTKDDLRMPPTHFTRPLNDQQRATLRQWVVEGAVWEKHWALIPPTRPELPAVNNHAWVNTPIDRFILARLEKEKLVPSPSAAPQTLIRRMSFDLTGIPPTPEEVVAFESAYARQPQAAVEALADRLLASPRYGERMAWRWIEAARYADTNGYQTDAERDMWRWRDWVIEAYNTNMPFDRFTIEQLAGDLLPTPTLEQRIATGFNRNHRGNSEGGIVPEEYAVEYVVDRVETTATVWLGLTFGCVRCHDHKYDPFTQTDFYQFFAYFNNVPEKGRAVKFGNSPPFIKAPTREQQARLDELKQRERAASSRWFDLFVKMNLEMDTWVETDAARKAPEKELVPGRVGYFGFEPRDSLVVRDGKAKRVPGKVGEAIALDGSTYVDAGDIGNFGFDDPFSLACWIKPADKNGAILTRTTDEPRADGYGVHLVNGRIQVHLTKRWLDDALRVESKVPVPLDEWHHLTVIYDGSRLASRVHLYLDGQRLETTILLDELHQTFETKEPFRIGTGSGKESRFRGAIDEVMVFPRDLEPGEAMILSESRSIRELADPKTKLSDTPGMIKLVMYYQEHVAAAPVREAYSEMRKTMEARSKFEASLPTVMVMEEMPKPRDSFILIRGEYDKRGAKVQPGIPTAFGKLPEKLPNNRLGLARWLVDRDNPLTARVIVNRMWQLHFGTGLVKTVEDFGTQGEYPSHPELLDWLATEFVRTGWDVKRMHKLIVTSAVYGQSSRMTKETIARDPENRLLARASRSRLSAEMLRDQALAASGLLVEKQGGRSVKPYQPSGLWKELSGAADYVPDHGENLYRRGLYTFWKRTVAPPGLMTFDAAGREMCWVRETRTNTPLQALHVLNDITFVEAARVLAQRIQSDHAPPEDRIRMMFRRLTGRFPTPTEGRILSESYQHSLMEYRDHPERAEKLLRIGASTVDPKRNQAELAALTSIARLILNLDETLTKE